MKNRKFRRINPIRTCQKEYRNYNSYKQYLKKDFNSRCGYCDSIDRLDTYSAVFHIDHFVPKKKFEKVYSVNDYGNLVYACPSCNRYKSDKWISMNPKVKIIDNKGFVDPCSQEYSNLFLRDESGKIIPTNDLSKYIFDELHLYLKRHELIYKLEKLEKIIGKFELLYRKDKLSESNMKLCLQLFFELKKYASYLNSNKT